jgi:hypothetical protein
VIMAAFATALAATLQGLFVWSVPMLALWWGFRGERSEPMWSRILELSSWLMLIGAMVGFGVWLVEHQESRVSMDSTGHPGSMAKAYGARSGWYWLRPVLLLIPACVFLFRRCRRSWWVAWALALLLSNPFGLFERLVIVITSFHRDYLPSSWTRYHVWMDLLVPVLLLLSALLMWRTQHRISAQRSA